MFNPLAEEDKPEQPSSFSFYSDPLASFAPSKLKCSGLSKRPIHDPQQPANGGAPPLGSSGSGQVQHAPWKGGRNHGPLPACDTEPDYRLGATGGLSSGPGSNGGAGGLPPPFGLSPDQQQGQATGAAPMPFSGRAPLRPQQPRPMPAVPAVMGVPRPAPPAGPAPSAMGMRKPAPPAAPPPDGHMYPPPSQQHSNWHSQQQQQHMYSPQNPHQQPHWQQQQQTNWQQQQHGQQQHHQQQHPQQTWEPQQQHQQQYAPPHHEGTAHAWGGGGPGGGTPQQQQHTMNQDAPARGGRGAGGWGRGGGGQAGRGGGAPQLPQQQRGSGPMAKFYKPSFMHDPWAPLEQQQQQQQQQQQTKRGVDAALGSGYKREVPLPKRQAQAGFSLADVFDSSMEAALGEGLG